MTFKLAPEHKSALYVVPETSRRSRQVRGAAYFEVLHDLRKLRDEIDATIASLERISSAETSFAHFTASPPTPQVGALPGRGLKGALISLLQKSERPLTNAEIVDRLKGEGVEFRSRNPALAVAQALSRMVKETGPVVKLGRGLWAARAHG